MFYTVIVIEPDVIESKIIDEQHFATCEEAIMFSKSVRKRNPFNVTSIIEMESNIAV